jgi:hypothetical protein
MSGTIVAHNVLRQIALRMATGMRLVSARYLESFGALGVAAAGLVVVRWAMDGQPWVLASAAATISQIVLAYTRHTLRVREIFPEVARIPVLRGLIP